MRNTGAAIEVQPQNSSGKPEPATYTVEEAADILRISRSAAYAAARNGDLPVLRIGARILVLKARLDHMLAGEVAS